ncbi:hypothetical protein PtA15_3A322 [Puccinia triticina]|uniref:Uncharacterized protein n=1 Tax=Puccinia triticina TaxID=208348 RepID=A0ABY7CCK8_9BASI|nr:uncharacterized protein PtA15_3A322 [Puccinia triticina]WAQ82956.1 hypothetical protein PtA15_3A322 [Puccinia triticina]
MIAKSLLAWLVVLPHLDVAVAMNTIRPGNGDAALASFRVVNEPNQLAESANTKVASFPKLFPGLRSWSKRLTCKEIAIIEDPNDAERERYYNHIFGPDAEDRKTDRCSTRQWLSGGAFDERLDSAFRHKYISREEILSNLLKKFGKIENEPPQDLSDEMKSDLDEALRILFLTQNGKDPETPTQIAHYFQDSWNQCPEAEV